MYRIPFAAGWLAVVLAGPATATPTQYIQASLTAETATPRPGQTILVGIQMAPKPGWHGYWSNPGESGLAPVVEWTAPHGILFGQLQHSAPTLMRVMGLTSYVHVGPHMLLARMSVDRDLPVGTVLPIAANVRWAACSDRLCVPQNARLTLRLKVGDGSPSPAATVLRHALAKEPKPLSGGAFSIGGGRVLLVLPASARLRASSARFFPDENGYWDPIKTRVVGDRPLKMTSTATGKVPNWVTGVATDGASAYRVKLKTLRQP